MRTDKSRRRWYLLVPFLYVVVIAGLLYLQFGGRTLVRQAVGGLDVSAATRKNMLGADRLIGIGIRYGPLHFNFSAASSATLQDASGTTERLGPTEYSVTSEGLTLILGDRIELFIAGDDARMTVLAAALAPLPAGVSLSVPLSFDARSTVSTTPGLPLLQVRQASCTFYLSAPDGASVDPRSAMVPLTGDAQVPFLAAERCSTVGDHYRYWFGQVAVPGDTDAYGRLVDTYLRSCYAAWQTQLASADLDPLSQGSLVTAFLSESLARGALPQAVALVQPRVALALSQGKRPADAAPACFLGMSQAYWAAGRSAAAALLEEVTAKLGSSDAEVFATPHLAATVLDYGSTSLLEQLLRFGSTIPVDAGSPETLLDLARFYADLAAAITQADGVGSRLEEILSERIIPSLRRTERGVFFLPAAGSAASLERTIAAGRLLVDAAVLLDLDSLAFTGRQCILSALSFAASGGALPAGIRLEGTRLIPTSELLPAEEVYGLIAEGRYLPAERPLHAEVGPGVSLLCPAEVMELAFARGTLRMKLAFAVRQTYYLILQGVPGVAQLELHGLAWRPDPEYARYTDGWWYAADTQTLYLKCTQQSEAEELVLTFP